MQSILVDFVGVGLDKLADLRGGRMLPPSSRSFHELFAEILWLHDDIRALRNETAMLREEIATIREEASVKLDAHDTHSNMMLWPLLALDGETEAVATCQRRRAIFVFYR